MNTYLKKICYGVVIILFIALCMQLDYRHMYAQLKNTPIRILAILVILQVFTQVMIAYQYLRLSKRLGEEMTLFKMLYINSFGTVVEGITPGVKIGGEAVKIFKIKEATSMSSERSAVLILTQKVISMSVFLFLCAISLLYLSGLIEIENSIVIKYGIYIVLMVIGVYVVFRGLLKERFDKFKDSIAKGSHLKLQKILDQIKSAVNEIKADNREIIIQVGIAFIIWLLYPLKLYLIISMFDGSIGFLGIIAITFISYIAGMIPIFPGGLLGFELAMTSLLLLIGLDMSHITFVTCLFRFITFWLVVIVSAIFIGCVELTNKINCNKVKGQPS